MTRASLIVLGLSLVALANPLVLASAAPEVTSALLVDDPPIVDNFNRSDENPLSDSGRWSILANANPKVLSNQLAGTSANNNESWRTDVRYGLDQEAMITIATKPADGQWVRLYVRLQKPSALEGYAVRLQVNSAVDQLFIERIVGGSFAVMRVVNQEFSAGDKLKVRAIGGVIEAWHYYFGGWFLRDQAADLTFLGVGYVGVGVKGTTARLDDFGAATLREPIPDPRPPIDNFNRPDENPLSDGGRWSYLANANPKVVSNLLAGTTWNNNEVWRNDVRYGLDQEAWVTIDTEPAIGEWVRVWARLQKPTVFDGYAVRYQNNAGLDRVFIERFDNGASSTLQIHDEEFMPGDKLKIRTAGSVIEAWRRDNNTGNWSMLGTPANDATYVGVGYVGLSIKGTTGRLDDFGAATLRAPGADPSTPIDSFNRQDENPLSDAGRWSYLANANPKVVSNRLAGNTWNNSEAWRTDVRYGIDQEAWVTIETEPAVGEWVRVYARLQKPTSFSGYAVRYQNEVGTDRVVIEKFSNGTLSTLVTFNREFVQGDKLRIRAVGSTIEAWRGDNYTGSWTKLAEATDSAYVASGYLGLGIKGTGGRLDDFGGGATMSLDPDSLLNRYLPELRYDVFETFRADSAAVLTDNFQPEYSNTLIVPSLGFLAQANPDLPEDDLSLDYLGLTYPPGGLAQGRASTADDHIDEEDNHVADAQRMHGNPTYADKVYGRVVSDTGGRITLQYWFFYYFNWHPLPTGRGDHEGDWEMVQVELDAFGLPLRTAYAQHTGGETCPWPLVSKTSDGRPIVYVAKGSHASYYSPGYKVFWFDEVGGNAPPITPSVIEINPPAPSWLDWPGRWGDIETNAPVGPAQKGLQWLAPASWADNLADSCFPESARISGKESTRSDAAVIPPRPPAPSITATRQGGRVRVSYSFAVWPKDPNRRPIALLTAVQSSGTRYPPFTKRHRISTRRGVVKQPLGLGKGPFKLHAAAYSRLGRSSKTVTVPVRPS